ncbi:MAG: hypothetical protein J0H94_11645 [Rhizobiales bacterium]|nr:hypothetical protein [Hyphomicrobiales bacterium]
MPFEALSEKYEFSFADFPAEWLPLTSLYDPDLPLFPVVYFHELDPNLPAGNRPGHKDRVFGFIRYVNLTEAGAVVGVVLNKDLKLPANAQYRPVVEQAVRDRLGLGDPIRQHEFAAALGKDLASANRLLQELWHQIVAPGFGGALPFGKMWDGVFGLVRFVASWNSEGGRKGELIQTHYFVSHFGERIAAGNTVNADFYLLPTMGEFQDETNPLHLFPRFAELIGAASAFAASHCTEKKVGAAKFSSFNRAAALHGGKLNTANVRAFYAAQPPPTRRALTENYNAFNRGTHRPILALMMLHDLRRRYWDPSALTPALCAAVYIELQGTFQSPKVIELYGQQCFGVRCALPIDNWVETFLARPVGFKLKAKESYAKLFEASGVWGRVERLIWVASQARKVHSSVAADVLWCVRFGGPEGDIRGANPLSCKICLKAIRDVCPGFAAIKDREVVFNATRPAGGFSIATSGANATAPNQTFGVVCGQNVYDEYSAHDRPDGFKAYPQPRSTSGPFTVGEFIADY